MYLPAAAAGDMTVRVYAFTPLETHERLAQQIKKKGKKSSPWLHVGGVKVGPHRVCPVGSANLPLPSTNSSMVRVSHGLSFSAHGVFGPVTL